MRKRPDQEDPVKIARIARRTAPLAAAVFLVCSAAALAQFEGVADFKATTVSGRGETIPGRGTFYVSKNAVRGDWEMDLQAGAKKDPGAPDRYRSTILERISEPDKMYMLNPEKKTYFVLDLKKARESMPKDTAKYTVTRAGRDTVAGLSCEKAAIASSSGSRVEVCVTRELTPSAAWLSVMNRDRTGFLGALRANGLDGFPIRMIARAANNKDIVSSYELVRVERKALPPSTFEIPPGYTKSSMASMRTPEQEKAMKDALSKMTPEQRKRYEEMMKKQKDENRQ